METKICTVCQKTLPISEFYQKGKTSSGKIRIAAECKECFKERERVRYEEQYEAFNQYKTYCKKCGEKRKYLLDFHHRDPSEKEFTVAHWRKKSKDLLAIELEQCDNLCKNCHTEFHYFERTVGITYPEYIQC